VVLCLPFAVPAFVSSFTWVSLSADFEGLGGAILVMALSKYPLVFLPVARPCATRHLAGRVGAHPGLQPLGRVPQVTLPLLWPSMLAARC
jgi:iron(III) transport system permease protein